MPVERDNRFDLDKVLFSVLTEPQAIKATN